MKDLLKRSELGDGKIKRTPMSSTIKLDNDEKGKKVDVKIY